MSTFRYRLAGVSPSGLDTYVEAGSGATTGLLARPPWTEVTLVDDTRESDLDEFMSQIGYEPDPTGPTVVVTAGPYVVGTEQAVLVDASAGPITVTVPLASSRLGDDLLVQKIDSSTNAVTVNRSGADTIDGALSQTLLQQGDGFMIVANSATTNWTISESRRARDITFDSSGLPTLTADNVQDAVSDILTGNLTAIEIFTSGEALTAGDLLTLDSAGEAIRADSSIGLANYEVIGVANQTVGSGVPVQVVTHTGAVTNVNFTIAVPIAFNGRFAFLSTTAGLASIAPPGAGGNAIFTAGVIQGADGITTSPAVVFRPQLVALRS